MPSRHARHTRLKRRRSGASPPSAAIAACAMQLMTSGGSMGSWTGVKLPPRAIARLLSHALAWPTGEGKSYLWVRKRNWR